MSTTKEQVEAEEKELNDSCRKLRDECWDELCERCEGDYDKINDYLNSL